MLLRRICWFRSIISSGAIVCLFSGFLIVGSSIFGLGQISQPQSFDPLTLLEPSSTRSREIAGILRHRYKVELGDGQLVNIVVNQVGIDVRLSLLGPDGNLVADVDSESGVGGTETISIVGAPAGSYEVQVGPTARKAAQGSYSITSAEIRPVTANDRSLFQAFSQYYDSLRLLKAGGQNDRALELAKSSLETRERILGAQNKLVTDAMIAVGRIYTVKNDIGQAELNILRALERIERSAGEESLAYAEGLSALGGAVLNRGDLKTAERHLKESLRIQQKYSPNGAFRTVSTLSTLGLVYRAMTDFRQGELTFRRALEICENTVGEDHFDTSSILTNLGVMYYAAGDYPNAETAQLRSLAIRERLFGPNHRHVGQVLNNLGLVEWRKGDYVKAEASWQRALGIFETVNGPESDGVANVLGNLAIIYKENYSDYGRAEAAQKRALAIIRKLNGENSVVAGNISASLGLIYRSMGDHVRAETLTLEALSIYENSVGPSHQNVALALSTLAQLSAMRGDLAASLTYQKRIEAIDSAAIQTNLIMGSERQKIAFFSRLRNADRNITYLVNLAPESAESSDLVATQILRRKGRILDALAQNLSEFRLSDDPEDVALLKKLTDVTSEISKLTTEGQRKRTKADYESYVNSLLREREKVEAEISRQTAGLFVSTKPVELSEVRSVIPRNAALIEIAVYRPFEWNYKENGEPYGEARYIAFVIRNSGDIGWRDLGLAKGIDEAVGSLRSVLRDPKSADVRRLARSVDQKIMAPLRPLIGDATHLLISADGELNLLPFEALIDDGERYLVQRYSFSYLTSGRDLLRMQTKQASKSGPLIISNPEFGSPESVEAEEDQKISDKKPLAVSRNFFETYFAPLNGTSGEAGVIKSLFPQSRILAGAQATEASLKEVRSPSIIHFATHGFFLSADAPLSNTAKPAVQPAPRIDNPLLRSGLALAGANRKSVGIDDGILTALEASGLDLSGTKLVVLSACDTGIGEIRNGEGVYGLRRSFQIAGAESLVMSMWPVSDYVTRELMKSYYNNLRKGLGRGESLRQVQLEMIKKANRRHPFYWASFIQSGEWANLEGKR